MLLCKIFDRPSNIYRKTSLIHNFDAHYFASSAFIFPYTLDDNIFLLLSSGLSFLLTKLFFISHLQNSNNIYFVIVTWCISLEVDKLAWISSLWSKWS